MGLFRLILIGVFIYLILNAIGRLFFPWLYISDKRKSNYSNLNHEKNHRKEGEVSIENISRKNNKLINNDEGEYVDYEEVKD